ncbi:hypothetical protein BDV96DRAFT_600015 [Lophiotrema nucula]|uniref:Uncharacterized protein n=1 Tax=Lophiotrema nucula TaxID=690887 RepID=A0A6A5Z712_9PLEO|nr:hypothetical protein BDV96DRAFT_600015 [Lophiotrema nucula]
MPLNTSFQGTTDSVTRFEIVRSLWPRQPTLALQYDDLDWNAYFDYYKQECDDALHDQGRHVSLRTHEEIAWLAGHLQEHRTGVDLNPVLRSKLTQQRTQDEEDDMIEGSLHLTARLLVMMDIGTLRQGFSGRKSLLWQTDKSLRQCVHDYFGSPSLSGYDNLKLETGFTARNLERIAGIEIQWTNNLADHLRLVEDDSKVRVFHHASFLKWQQSLSEETLNTFALLFPQSDVTTAKWYRSVQEASSKSITLDGQLVKCGDLKQADRDFERFHFWRERLVCLKQVFDQSRPKTLSQWWFDRRDGVQWYTFWAAILVIFLTILFGAVQSVEGAMQVYKAYHPT